jgi:hypothetical protein
MTASTVILADIRSTVHSLQLRERQFLDPKFKIPKVSHRMVVVLIWRIKYRRNKKLIAQFACKLRDESNETN